MKARQLTLLGFSLALTLFMPGSVQPSSVGLQAVPFASATIAPDRTPLAPTLHSVPLLFIENTGQFDARIRFQAHLAGGVLWLAEDGLWLTVIEGPASRESPSLADAGEGGVLSPSPQFRRGGQGGGGVHIRLSFVGANPRYRLEPFNRLDTHISYFIGDDPTKWHADVPAWGGVRYVDLYPGIDLELAGKRGQWQPSFIIRPGADLSAVRLRVEGVAALALEGEQVRLTTAIGPVFLPPFLSDGGAALQPTIINDTIAFAPHPFNPFPESVDSVSNHSTDLLYSTFLGGSNSDRAYGIAVDTSGAAYITGYTPSVDFPTTPGAFQRTCGGCPNYDDAFVVKLNATGSELVYATFLGGTMEDGGDGIYVDVSGVAYVMGSTRSPDFPITPGAYQVSCGGNCVWPDLFVTKLGADPEKLDWWEL